MPYWDAPREHDKLARWERDARTIYLLRHSLHNAERDLAAALRKSTDYHWRLVLMTQKARRLEEELAAIREALEQAGQRTR